MKINVQLNSESATKRQQDNAKLLFGAKGKTLIAALDKLVKVKRQLNEEQTELVLKTQAFLKQNLDEKTIARLKKRKGFITLPTRIVKLEKSIAALLKLDVKGVEKQFAPVQKHISKYADTGSTRNVEDSLYEIFNGAKRDISAVKKALAKLKPMASKLKKYDLNMYNSIMQLLKTNPTENPKSHNAKILERLPTILKTLTTLAPKYLKASEAVSASWKGLPAFTKLLAKELASGEAATQGASLDKASKKAAKTIKAPGGPYYIELEDFKPNRFTDNLATKLNLKFEKDGKDFKVYGSKRNLSDFRYQYFAEDYAGDLDSMEINLPIEKAGNSSRKNSKAKSVSYANRIATALNVEESFVNLWFKDSGIKTYDNIGAALEFNAKGSLFVIATRLLKQLRKRPEFTSSILWVYEDSMFIDLVGTNKSLKLEKSLQGGSNEWSLHESTIPTIRTSFSDGTSLMFTVGGLSLLSDIQNTVRSDTLSQDTTLKRKAKADMSNLEKLSLGVEAGMTFAKVRGIINKLSQPTKDKVLNQFKALNLVIA